MNVNFQFNMRIRIQVIYIYVVAFSLIALYAIIWYALNQAVQALIMALTTAYPSAYDQTTVTLLTNLWTYSPVLMLFGCLLWVYVYSQKHKPEVYEY